jgi:hypothetical protein
MTHRCSSRLPIRSGIALVMASVAVVRFAPAGEVVEDVLPDIAVAADALAVYRIDTTTLPGRRLLRLSTSTPNLGVGPLEIRGSTVISADRQDVVQRVYRSDGTFWERPAGTSTYHTSHAHIHFDDWAVYRLRMRQSESSGGDVVATGAKTSFCLRDLVSLPTAAPSPRYETCGQAVQGISPGWADVYDLELPDQWIDITHVPNGNYWLECEVDPDNRILESAERNNVARIPIVLGPAPRAQPDRYEPNDSRGAVVAAGEAGLNSANFGVVQHRVAHEGLSMTLEAVDYYSFRLEHEAPVGAYVRIESEYLIGDLDLYVFDTQDNLVGASDGGGNFEQVALGGIPAGTYFVVAVAYTGENPNYALIISPEGNVQPSVELTTPSSGPPLWVERAFEVLPVTWAVQPSALGGTIALRIARQRTLDKNSIVLRGYQYLSAEAGRANVNTTMLPLGLWFLHAQATTADTTASVWAPAPFIVYLKGDLNGDGLLDAGDQRVFTKEVLRCRGPLRTPRPEGWEHLLDMDRDGDVDSYDVAAFWRATSGERPVEFGRATNPLLHTRH